MSLTSVSTICRLPASFNVDDHLVGERACGPGGQALPGPEQSAHKGTAPAFARGLSFPFFICYITQIVFCDQECGMGKGAPRTRQEALLAELEGIRDIYRTDVKQFIGFVRERKLLIVDGFKKYAAWLEEDHEGKRYSPATINRRLAAARNRIRYAFKHSAFGTDLRRRFQLEEVLRSVKLKKVDVFAVSSDKVLDIEEARKLIRHAKDATIKLMVSFLLRTGLRVSEMLSLKLTDLGPPKDGMVPVRITGKGGKERTIQVKADSLDRIRKHFAGETYLFEHQRKKYSRVSVTNRIKHEALRILGREVSAQHLRHTWAAIQIKRGRSVSSVALLLGHSSPGLTAAMYPESAAKSEEPPLDLDETDDAGGRPSKRK
jgi:integrase/recombinase XerD